MLTQSQIDRICAQHKAWYWKNYPVCGYCGHRVRKEGELSHIIRRSYSRELQTVKLNTCLAHHDCHEIWDDKPDQHIYLPRIVEVLYIIFLLSPEYFHQIAGNYESLAHILQLFPSVEYRDIEHHGQVLQLIYLYQ
jgi:lipopolysaccharide biosynthesis protein